MADDESPQAGAESYENKSVIGLLIRILDKDGSIVKKDGLGLLE